LRLIYHNFSFCKGLVRAHRWQEFKVNFSLIIAVDDAGQSILFYANYPVDELEVKQ